MRKRILLTGAAGNVGRLLQSALIRAYDVVPTDLPTTNPSGWQSFQEGNLADPEFVNSITENVDAVVHLASAVGPDLDFEQTLDANYRALLNLLEACRRKGISRFIFASSHHVLGSLPADQTYSEHAPLAPDGYYGLSKAFGEAACSMFSQRYGIRTLCVRIGNADPKVVDGRRERLWTSGDDLMQWIEIGIQNQNYLHAVVNGVSNCPSPLLRTEAASFLGYVPLDHSTKNRSELFVPLEEIDQHQRERVGGYFATAELPKPAARRA